MEILTQAELRLRFEEIIEKIKKGSVFIHPTDTIYGIGGNALQAITVKKLRNVKEQFTKPFSIWVPSLEWVKENCVITKKTEKWLKKLPGSYTLILKLKNKLILPENVTLSSRYVGIRYPNHWFGKIVEKAGVPIITTSANKTGQPFMKSIEQLDHEVGKETEFIIYEGMKEARPSTIINVEKEEVNER